MAPALPHAARYPFADKLLDRLCPIGPERLRPPRVYHNLPAPTYSQFVMREQAFAEVREGLGKQSAIVLIVGLGGNGKTSLAREAAARCLADDGDMLRFDAVVWVSDKDRPGTTNLSIVLDEITRTLDYPGFTQFEHDEKRREVENLLRRQHVLIVVDNFETITDGALLSWLQNLSEPSKALITAREYRREYRRGGWLVELRGMTDTEAHEFVGERLRMLRIAHLVNDQAQLEPLLVATGGNPKAIEIALGLVKHEHRPLQQVVDDLYTARGELFDDLFTRAWALLDEAARRVLIVMTFFPASASGAALAATAEVQGFAFDRVVERLMDLALLDVQQEDLNSAPRYMLHPLVRAFAGAKLGEQRAFEEGARERWISFFDTFAVRCHNDGWDLPYQFDRAEHDIDNFQAVIHVCHKTQQWQRLIEIVIAIRMFWNTRGYYKERNAFVDMALHAAQALNNIQTHIFLLSIKVRTLCYLGEVQLAIQYCDQARDLLQNLSCPDPSLVESVNDAHIRICFRTGNVEKQLELAQWNVDSGQKRLSKKVVLHRYYVADYLYLVRRYDEAEALFLELIEESKTYGYQRSMITGWLSLARIALHKRQLEVAEQRLILSQEIAQGIRHRRYLAEADCVRAELCILRGDLPAARAALTEAIDRFERLGMRRELAEARAELARLDE